MNNIFVFGDIKKIDLCIAQHQNDNAIHEVTTKCGIGHVDILLIRTKNEVNDLKFLY